MAWAAIGGSVAGALVTSVLGGGKSSGGGQQQASAAADPFASQRGQYQEQLSTLMSDPSSEKLSAGEKWSMDQGLDSLGAKFGSQGLFGSGNAGAGLEKYAIGTAQQGRQQEISNLMQLSGANSGSPGTAGQIQSNAATGDQNARDSFGNQIGRALVGPDGFSSWLGGSNQTAVDPNAAMMGPPSSMAANF